MWPPQQHLIGCDAAVAVNQQQKQRTGYGLKKLWAHRDVNVNEWSVMHRNAVIVLKWFIKCVKKNVDIVKLILWKKTGLNVKRFNSFIEYSILYVKKIDTVYNSVISDLHGHLDEFWSPSTTPRGSHGVFLILVNAKSSFAEYWGNIAITLCDYFSLFSGAQHKPHTYF